jgi:hypothetical protein
MMTPLNSETNNIFVFVLFAAIAVISITIIAAIWISVFKPAKITPPAIAEETVTD